MKLRMKFHAKRPARTYCRCFQMNLLFWWSIFDGTNIHRTAIYGKTFLTQWLLTLFPVTCVKNVLCNVVGFTIVHFSEAATGGVLLEKGALGNFAKWSGKHFWSFSCLLLKISCLFHSNRKMRWKKGKYPDRAQIFIIFARVLICLTSKILKEIWQTVIWSENLFKENLLLQFSWLEEFR